MTIRGYIAVISSVFLLGAGVLQAQHMHLPDGEDANTHISTEMHHTYAHGHECSEHYHSENNHTQEQHACDVCQVIAASNALLWDALVSVEARKRIGYRAEIHTYYVKSASSSAYSGRGPPMPV